ncbi:hypothetical protein [Rhodanobacter sp. DHB23]|uniref:hypothetical protein n=1 Tax=Rhodanobacter sp. DHB23 TaxID=2775923 RepID=UPI001784543E|nr:hypothetical protein [Rhodanobacter sp. DHB23]MBD8873586.1 hypothetical protein [Rhodanobacter sp. DHB23]
MAARVILAIKEEQAREGLIKPLLLVIPAKAGQRSHGSLLSGFRRDDEQKSEQP